MKNEQTDKLQSKREIAVEGQYQFDGGFSHAASILDKEKLRLRPTKNTKRCEFMGNNCQGLNCKC